MPRNPGAYYAQNLDYTADGIDTFETPRAGRGKITLQELQGPYGLFFMSGYQHTFLFKYPADTNPYDNAVMDPVFDWLEENAAGAWNWDEIEANHGHSVTTRLHIADTADIAAFRERWSGLFALDERDQAQNDEVRRKEDVSRAANTLPWRATERSLVSLVPGFNETVGKYLSALEGRDGFCDWIVETAAHVDAKFAAKEPDQFGPRRMDGSLEPRIVGGVSAFASWAAVTLPEEAVNRIGMHEFADAEIGATMAVLKPGSASPTP